jgi:hypothetical protein
MDYFALAFGLFRDAALGVAAKTEVIRRSAGGKGIY